MLSCIEEIDFICIITNIASLFDKIICDHISKETDQEVGGVVAFIRKNLPQMYCLHSPTAAEIQKFTA